MNWTRNVVVCLAATAAIGAFAEPGSNSTAKVDQPSPELRLASPSTATTKARADAGPLSFLIPKVGVRVGAGNWNEFMVEGGVDVTFNVPLLPIPALRVDGEVWGKPSDFGQDRRGNAVSLLGIQTFSSVYAGLGPSYYFTDNEGDHQSGFGIKLLAGMQLQHGIYVEAATIIGPSEPAVFFTIGQRF